MSLCLCGESSGPDTVDRLLAIETTCDETAAAVLEGPRPPAVGVPRIRLQRGGLAGRAAQPVRRRGARDRLARPRPADPAHDRRGPERAGVGLRDLDAVAVATRPGLVGALVVGLTAAKTLALALDIPLIAVNHLEGHLYACQLAYPTARSIPASAWSSPGGHTSLYRCRGPARIRAAGRHDRRRGRRGVRQGGQPAGLGYPGGPAIERVATAGNPKALRASPGRSCTTTGWSSASPA